MKVFVYVTNAGNLHTHGTDGFFSEDNARMMIYRSTTQNPKKHAYFEVGEFERALGSPDDVKQARLYSQVAGSNGTVLRRLLTVRNDWTRK